MSTPRSQRSDPLDSTSLHSSHDVSATHSGGPNPTYATFSPTTLSSTTPSTASAAKRRSTILVHQKSPLLLATPPQVTRALAYSHPFLLPLNKIAGLLSWTTGDPWESFLLVVAYWTAILYGDVIIRYAGPLVLVLLLIGGMYGRRYSPLSSSGVGEPRLGTAEGNAISTADPTKSGKVAKHAGKQKNLSVDATPGRASKMNTGTSDNNPTSTGRARSQTASSVSTAEATSTRHQKTLDEIVETLKEFTGRCNILLEPLLELTDFLSTQQTPTSATTRPALTTLFVRILLCSPVWFALTLPPWRIITTRRVLLVFGTFILTWHSRVMRVSRVILWRSATLRRLLALTTGLRFEQPVKPSVSGGTVKKGVETATATTATSTSGDQKSNGGSTVKDGSGAQRESELTRAIRRARKGRDAGVRFTFIIYENQRRWVGLGWTNSLFSYERAAWTDEHNNSVPPRDQFELPEVEDGSKMRWMWVEGSRWRVDGVPDEAVASSDDQEEWDYDGPGGRMGWVYYDNKWQNGRRGQDGWGRWTRRRKWYRDAELVELEDVTDTEPSLQASIAVTEASEPATNEARQDGPSPKPDLPPRPGPVSRTPTSASVTSDPVSTQPAVTAHEEDDTASVLSTSSKSARFGSMRSSTAGTPKLRRRATGESSRKSGRRASDAVEEEDAAVLGTSLGLSNRDTDSGWSVGVGDEVRMGLE
ncbi:peroxisomal membrane protein PEX30 [Coniochaeta pulveracea]|nr:peroxisomal membrane protein PEX30 [Coniochaeta pulveracea]